MSSEQTEKSSLGKNQIPNDWMPASAIRKRKSSEPFSEEMEVEFQKILQEGFGDGNSPKPKVSDESESNVFTDDSIRKEDRNDTLYSVQTESSETKGFTLPVMYRRVSGKKRKESLEEYRQTFLGIPKLNDRKPVFISCEVRDRIDEIVHRLGGRGRSVSGFIENLARHHLDMYEEEIEAWRKL